MTDTPDEFSNSIPLDKCWRYRVEKTNEGTFAHFGLLGIDGQIRYFKARADRLPLVAIEIAQINRLAKTIDRGGTSADFVPYHLPFKDEVTDEGFVLPFAGPGMKLIRAATRLSDLEDIVQQFSARVELTVEKIGEDGEDDLWEVDFSEPIPMVIPLMVGDVVHNLRSALDLTVCDLARLRGTSTSGLKFHFAKNATELEDFLKPHRNRLGTEMAQEIAKLRPFKEDGDPDLRGLHDLDVIDKHRLVVPTLMAAWRRYDYATALTDAFIRDNPGVEPPFIHFVTDEMDLTFVRRGEILKRRRGEDPLRLLKPHGRGIEARFQGKDSSFAGQPILPSLARLYEMVRRILADFHRKFGPIP